MKFINKTVQNEEIYRVFIQKLEEVLAGQRDERLLRCQENDEHFGFVQFINMLDA